MATEKKPGKAGRPSLYKPEFATAVREMSKHGWTDVSIASAFGVDVVTIWRWRTKYPEFGAASVATEEERLQAMRSALYHRGIGYSHKGVKIVTASVDGAITDVKEIPYEVHYPPDVTAMKFYLTNKSAGEYVERQETETRGDVTVRIEGGLPTEKDENSEN